MTVQDNTPSVTHIGTGAQISFPFAFRVNDAAWLNLDFLTDFDQFILNPDQDIAPGGSVEYLVAPPLAQALTVTRDTPNTQELNYTRYDPFDSESHEDALDRLTMQIQDLEFTLGGSFTVINAHIADVIIHFADAPNDGNDYVRNNNLWVIASPGGVTDHLLLTNIGVNTHAQIDSMLAITGAHIADGLIHFSEGSIDHTNILNVGVNTHVQIDSHIADGLIHFSEGSIDHTNILNVGVNTHADIDSMLAITGAHIADGSIHFSEGSIDHANILNIGVNTHAQIDAQLITLALKARGITIENPLTNDNFAIFFTDVEIIIQQLNFVLQGTVDATVFISFGPDRSTTPTDVVNAGTVVSNSTVGQEIAVFDNPIIPAGNWVVVRITAITATPDELNVSMVFV